MNLIEQAVTEATEQWKLTKRAEMISLWEAKGWLDPNCPGCQEFYKSPGLPSDVFAPSHKASNECESGKRAHCTCDTCF